MGEIVNKQRLQAILGKDHKTILKWQKEGMPVQREGERGQSNDYDTGKVIDWLVKRASETATALEIARVRHTNAQAEKTELEVEVLKGNLIPLETMKIEWGDVVGAFRAKMLAMPSNLGHRLAALREPRKIEKALKESIYEALAELAKYEEKPNKKPTRGGKGGSKRSGSAS